MISSGVFLAPLKILHLDVSRSEGSEHCQTAADCGALAPHTDWEPGSGLGIVFVSILGLPSGRP